MTHHDLGDPDLAAIHSSVRIGHEPIQKPGKSKQDYGTPWSFIHACERRFGPIIFDLAADAQNAKAPRFWTIDDDTYSKDWASELPNGNLWFNPEFKQGAQAAAKCALEAPRRHGLILMLTLASVGSNWFSDHVHRKAMVMPLSPRLTFADAPINPKTGKQDPYPKDLMLSAYGMGLHGFEPWRWDSTPNGGDLRE